MFRRIELEKVGIRLEENVHPCTACYAILSNALMKNTTDAYLEAARKIREMYRRCLISPLETAYIIYYVLPSNVVHMGELIDPDTRSLLPFIDFVRIIIKNAFAGIPVEGEIAKNFIRAGGHLEWMHNLETNRLTRFYDIEDFFYRLVSETPVTMDLLEMVFVDPTNLSVARNKILGPASRVADHISSAQCTKQVISIAKKETDRFITMLHRFLRPMMEEVLYDENFDLTPFPFHYDLNKVSRLCYYLYLALCQQSEDSKLELSDESKKRLIQIAMLLSFLTTDQSMAPHDLVSFVIETGMLRDESAQPLVSRYMAYFERVLYHFCSTDFLFDRGSEGYFTWIHKARTALRLAVQIDAKAAGCVFAGAYATLPSRKEETFGGVSIYGVSSYATTNRFYDVLGSAVLGSSQTFKLIVDHWPGIDDRLDQLVAKLVGEVAGTIA